MGYWVSDLGGSTGPTSGRDTFVGDETNETADGLDGDDILWGFGGDDELIGSGGDDAITGHGGDDTLVGGDGNDSLYGEDGNDVLSGGSGDDWLIGGGGIDTVIYSGPRANYTINLHFGMPATVTGDGFDRLDGVDFIQFSDQLLYIGPSSLWLPGPSATAGNDTFMGTGEAETANGLAGNDTLSGGGGNDTLIGGEDDDQLYGDLGDDSLQGGSGTDTVVYFAPRSNFVITLSEASITVIGEGVDTLTDIEFIQFSDQLVAVDSLSRWSPGPTATAGNDTYTGTSAEETADGLAGNDTIYGGGGADALFGGAGDDTLIGGAGADHVDGGAGIDTADYSGASTGVTVNLQDGVGLAGDASGDTLTGIENVRGGGGSDTLVGDGGVNIFYGSAGLVEHLSGLGGNDVFDYRAANLSTFEGGTFQQLFGGAGDDVLYLPGSADQYSIGFNDATSTTYFIYAGVMIQTAGVERVVFANAPQNPVSLANASNSLVLEMVRLADMAYNGWQNHPLASQALADGWRYMTAIELGIPRSTTGSGVSYTFDNGVYVAGTQQALVVSGQVNGQSTLSIAFEGTNELGDLFAYLQNFGTGYSQFAPLVSSLVAYIRDNHIQQVLISGHSLGGALAQLLTNELQGYQPKAS